MLPETEWNTDLVFLKFEDRTAIAVISLFMAVVINFVAGFFYRNFVPIIWKIADFVFSPIIEKLNKHHRSQGELFVRGMIVTVIIIILFTLISFIAEQYILHSGLGDDTVLFIFVALLLLIISGGSLFPVFLFLGHYIKTRNLPNGLYYELSRASRQDLNSLDDHGEVRTAIKILARNFEFGCLVPVFWFLVSGLTGAYLACAVLFVFWRYGEEGHDRGFGKLAGMLAYIISLPPGILYFLCILIAGLVVPTFSPVRMIEGLVTRSASSFRRFYEGGLGLIAMAWGFNIALGGPVTEINGRKRKNIWVGPDNASARIPPATIKRAVYFMAVSYLVFALLLLAALYTTDQADISSLRMTLARIFALAQKAF